MTNRYADSTNGGGASSPFTSRATAGTTIAGVFAVMVAGDREWVRSSYSNASGAAITWQFPATAGGNTELLGAGDWLTDPPTSLGSGALENTNANAALNIQGFGYVTNISVQMGAGAIANGAQLNLATNNAPAHLVLESMPVYLNGSTGTGPIAFGPVAASTNDDVSIIWRNSTFRFGGANNFIRFGHGRFLLDNITNHASSTAPTTLFKFSAGVNCEAVVENSDLSTILSGKNLLDWGFACGSTLTLRNCKLPASYTPTTGANPGPGGPKLRILRSASGDTQDYFYEASYEGTVEYNSSIYRTAGSVDDDAVGFSAKLISTANTNFYDPLQFDLPAIVSAVGSSVTLTTYLAVDGSAPTLTDQDVYVEVEAFTTSGSTLGVVQTSRPTIIATGTNLTTSTEAWTGLGGTNAKFEIALIFTPREKGYYRVRLCIIKPSLTIYADCAPLVV